MSVLYHYAFDKLFDYRFDSQMLKGLLLQLYTSRISINMNIHNHYPYNLINLICCKDNNHLFNSINVVAYPGRSDDDLNVLCLFLHFHIK